MATTTNFDYLTQILVPSAAIAPAWTLSSPVDVLTLRHALIRDLDAIRAEQDRAGRLANLGGMVANRLQRLGEAEEAIQAALEEIGF